MPIAFGRHAHDSHSAGRIPDAALCHSHPRYASACLILERLWNLEAVCDSLLAQSIRRAERMAIAMEAKGFADGASRTYYIQTGYSRADLYFVLYFIATLTMAYTLGWQFPYYPAMLDVR